MKSLLVMIFLHFMTSEAWADCFPKSRIKPRSPDGVNSCDDLPGETANCIEGKRLFFSTNLSRDKTVSCASCHVPNLAFTDKLARPKAREQILWVSRTPSLIDIHKRKPPFFWNGRAKSVISAVFWPLYHPDEIDASDEVIEKLGGSHKIAKNISSFLKTISTGLAPIDEHLAGDCQALSPPEKTGLEIFLNHCTGCHEGTEFDGKMKKIKYKNLPKEYFRMEEASYLSQSPLHNGFKQTIELTTKVPSPRNIQIKGPPYGRFGQEPHLKGYLEYHIWQTGAPAISRLDDLEIFLTRSLQSHSLVLLTKRTGSRTSKKARSTNSSSNRTSSRVLSSRFNSGSGSK